MQAQPPVPQTSPRVLLRPQIKSEMGCLGPRPASPHATAQDQQPEAEDGRARFPTGRIQVTPATTGGGG